MSQRRTRKIPVRSEQEISILREANKIVAEVLEALSGHIEPGVTTLELNRIAEAMIRSRGGQPAFLGYRGYPASICVSVDEEIVHGIPGPRRLREGVLVSLDVGVLINGFFGDAAITVPCGRIDAERRRLLEVTERSLAEGIAAAAAGNTVSDISRAVQKTCECAGFSVVRCFVGHGIGSRLHEEPQVPNFITGQRGPLLKEGVVLAIEPMVNAGAHDAVVLEDGWTAVTADGRPSAHFEHSIVVRKHGGEILSETPGYRWGDPRELALKWA